MQFLIQRFHPPSFWYTLFRYRCQASRVFSHSISPPCTAICDYTALPWLRFWRLKTDLKLRLWAFSHSVSPPRTAMTCDYTALPWLRIWRLKTHLKLRLWEFSHSVLPTCTAMTFDYTALTICFGLPENIHLAVILDEARNWSTSWAFERG